MSNLIDQDRVRWPGSGSAVPGNTAYGFYDSDIKFVEDCYSAMIWAGHRLGYPIVDIELTDKNFYMAYEEAVNEYGSLVNQYNIANNMAVWIGQDSTVTGNVNNRAVTGLGLPYVVELAKDYGTETGTGGNVDWKRGHITAHSQTQSYDLQELWGDVSESFNRIEVKRVFHERTPAFQRIYDPFSMTGMSYSNMFTELGFGAYSPAVQFLMTPIFEDLLRGQAIEFNDMVRKSAYSFEIQNNVLHLMPIPQSAFNVYFDYVVVKDKYDSGSLSPSGSNSTISDFSDVPYTFPTYNRINEPGRQWIRKYFLACCKEMLGAIRQKYQTIPIPGGEVTLDGAELRSEAQQEKEKLIDDLKEMLELSGKHSQLEKQAQMAEQLQESLKRIPLYIYVG